MKISGRQIRKHLFIWLPAAWLVLVLFGAVTADFWPLPAPDHMDWMQQTAPPGTPGEVTVNINGRESSQTITYLLGTDTLGRDILARLVHGARVSLVVGLVSPLIGLVIGGFLGLIAGYYRGFAGAFISLVMDVILAFPALVFLLAIAYYSGSSMPVLVFSLGMIIIPAYYRVARANTLVYSQREFVQAARVIGANDIGIMWREILPNIFWPLMVYALILAAVLIMVEGALSFLGLGVAPPTPSWGGMIAEGREVLAEAPHVSLVPAGAMFLTALSFNLLGDELRALCNSKTSRM